MGVLSLLDLSLWRKNLLRHADLSDCDTVVAANDSLTRPPLGGRLDSMGSVVGSCRPGQSCIAWTVAVRSDLAGGAAPSCGTTVDPAGSPFSLRPAPGNHAVDRPQLQSVSSDHPAARRLLDGGPRRL